MLFEIELEARGQAEDVVPIDRVLAQARDQVHQFAAAEPGIEPHIAGQVSDHRPDRLRLLLAIHAQDARAARGRADQIEQKTNGGCFAGAVRAQEAEDFARLNAEIECIDGERSVV